MLSTTGVHACRHCGSERLQKNGHTQRGAQRALCLECQRTFTLSLAWVGEKVAALPAFEDTLLPGEKGDVLELDELWSFVEKKTRQCWRWVALCRRTRQIVAYTIADRSQEGAKSLREHVPESYRRRATRSDFWLAYEAAFPARTHRFCGKEEGETNHAERWFGTLRARVSRLVRRSYSFSKSVERHLEAIHLFLATHNLRLKHSTSA